MLGWIESLHLSLALAGMPVRVERRSMVYPNRKDWQCFLGTLEQCVEKHGGQSQFTVSAPLTFFSGARLETHRRAKSNDGTVLIVEWQQTPTICEVYLRAGIRTQGAPAIMPRLNCA